jgi:hypothetical protein
MTDRRQALAALMLAPFATDAAIAAPAPASGEVGSRAWYDRYLAAFNAHDYPTYGAYYADDVAFSGQAATLVGRDKVLDFYRGVAAKLDEHVELLNFLGSPILVAVEIRTTLHVREDWPDFRTGPLHKGDIRRSNNFAFYDIKDGRFTRVRSANFSHG